MRRNISRVCEKCALRCALSNMSERFDMLDDFAKSFRQADLFDLFGLFGPTSSAKTSSAISTLMSSSQTCPPSGQTTGDELAAIPYTYTIK